MDDITAVLLDRELRNSKSMNSMLSEKEVQEIIKEVLKKAAYLNNCKYEEIKKNVELKQELKECIEERCFTEINHHILKVTHGWNRGKWVEKWNGEFNIFKAFRLNLLNSIDKLSLSTIDYIEKDIDEILNQIPNPKEVDYFQVKGLVLGLVQMGKTTNMCGLICKALDIGYDIIILFTGTTKELRNQGQKRFEKDCYGRDTLTNERIGIGRYLGNIGFKLITKQDEIDKSDKYVDGDLENGFTKYVRYERNGKYVFICKRNTSIIKKINKWITEQEFYDKEEKIVKNVPLLLVQDECDQATINTEPEDKIPAATNRELRNLFKKFNKKVYIGYTATPFSNIFINPNPKNSFLYGSDFFPDDFIYLLKPPNNYLGPYEYFGKNSYPFIKEINKIDENSFPMNDKNNNLKLTNSLEMALINYFINGGIISLRGKSNEHHTMLINIDTYTEPQEQIYNRVLEYVNKVRKDILSKKTKYIEIVCQSIWEDMKNKTVIIENKDNKEKELNYKYNTDFHFKEVFDATLNYIMSTEGEEFRVKVKQINYKRNDKLEYVDNKDGLNVIVIGGFKLSRGLTLKGLSVAYFKRNSPQVDTQLQACRWFGYPKEYYRDLIRVYTTKEIYNVLKLSTGVINALENLIITMSIEKKRPDEFGLYVKKFKKIRITSYNKMRNATVLSKNKIEILKNNLIGQEFDVNTFYCSNQINRHNKQEFDMFIERLGVYKKENGAYFWRNSNPLYLIDFFRKIKVHERARILDLDKVCQYIEDSYNNNELKGIDVVLINIRKGAKEVHDVGNIKAVNTAKRTGIMTENSNHFIVNDGRALTVRHLKYGLSQDEIYEAENKSGHSFSRETTPSSAIVSAIRSERKAGVIIFYLLSINHLNCKSDSIKKYAGEKIECPPVAFHISLPGKREEGEEFIVNQVYMQQILDVLKGE